MEHLRAVWVYVVLAAFVLAGLGFLVADAMACGGGAGECTGVNIWKGYSGGCLYGPYGSPGEEYYVRCCEAGVYYSKLTAGAYCEGTDPSNCYNNKTATHKRYKYTIETNGCTASCGGSCVYATEEAGTHTATNVCDSGVDELGVLFGCTTCTP